MTNVEWLPPLVLMSEHQGDWNVYVGDLYRHYLRDFVQSRPTYDGKSVQTKRMPAEQRKEATFWHLISEGTVEADRLPDMRRCERICWVRPIIEHASDAGLKVWQNERKGDIRVCLWFEAAEFVVILAKRTGYYILWTAYPVVEEHRKRKFRREYEEYKKLASP
jgi:hypothetical protein